MRRSAALAILFSLAGVACADFKPTPTPVSPDGVAAVVDLPTSQHMKNVGGSDGAGLCVFTSLVHSSRWQNIRELDGFREWMQKKPGGGWPQKVDQMVAAYCREKGVAAPQYIQHTGGDETFLEAALHTDRMPAVTYAGRDDFYRGRIAHMVSLAHLDSTRAAIIDNNRPGVWLWMTRAEFLSRWRDMDGGWAVVFIGPPPPPHPAPGVCVLEAGPCICGDSCKCEAGKCPNKCPVAFGQCQGGRCPLPAAPVVIVPPAPAVVVADRYRVRDLPAGTVAPGYPAPAPGFLWKNIPGKGNEWIQDGDDWDWGKKPDGSWGWVARANADVAPGPDEENYGVRSDRIHTAPTYSLNGVEITRSASLAAMGIGTPLADDSDHWHLTAVGDVAFCARFRKDVDALPEPVRGKLLVQCYGADAWAVALFKLSPGVNLRAPSPGRISADIGNIPTAEYSAAKLAGLLSMPGGPVAPTPKPADPTKPSNPANPADPTNPAPAAPGGPSPLLLLILGAVAAWFLFRK